MHVSYLVSTCHPCCFCNAKTSFFWLCFVFRPVKSRKRDTGRNRKKHYSPFPRRWYSKWSSQYKTRSGHHRKWSSFTILFCIVLYKTRSGHHRFFSQWPIWKEKSNFTEDFVWYPGMMTISKCLMVKIGFSFQMSHWKRNLWWPSRISFGIQMTISSLIFSGTGCTFREVGGWGRVPFSRNLMSPTPRRKWYLTTGRRFH